MYTLDFDVVQLREQSILNIRFIVPRNRFLVPSKESFIFSAKAVESRISSPIAIVNCPPPKREKTSA
ncbi:hypothetical protein AC579_9734 [Pseudocercospora musae]|uniref:Uncharacterized protein n=1 Tax=Pseudocercospora musae TaxID=113226 RepID=A0A139I5Z5_9PEZI|nr:hypothetical protein AC579_9734 [Pseudocercospora musae]